MSLPKPSATEPGSASQDSAATFSQDGATSHDKDRLSVIVTEAEEFTLTDIPNDSIETIHGLLACMPAASDR